MPTTQPPDTFVPIAPESLATPRLRLRPWTAADRAPFAAMNADPAVMAHFSAPLARDASDAMADRIEALIAQRGWGFWAADCLQGDSGPRFMGFVGLHTPSAELPFAPCVEIGWRLARPFWGQGLASEAARLALRAGFEDLGLAEIVSFTTLGNQRSRAVMQRLGMRESPAEAFDHPAVPVGHPVRPHCLYRLARTDWHAGTHGG
ncbi:GNAT family N-acetyltransferase [Acidovorax sp. SUPP3434]|uniref:GNAT family N-acetyltransferase n=1 Tax=Acidovorax sp. SUPP3434 TaxID=2920880 RepID=UPI0023DE4CC4|nr:GNAT family N-acetyltransferase [Acidovorax sp. SUPP3434]GKT00615.1 GNAT family N-acetyltransferase [Acidovorax sp. SUPP3434]